MDLPDPETSPLALATHRVLRWLRAEELTDAEAAHGWSFSERIPDIAAAQQLFRVWARPIGEVTSFTRATPRRALLEIEDDRGRPFNLRVIASADDSGRVLAFGLAHRSSAEIVVRRATDDDADAIRALEAATPVEHDGATISYRRADPFAQFRLVDAAVVCLVAEVDGQLAAQHIDLHGTRRIAGAERTCAYRMRTRIRPEFQGRKLWPALNWATGEAKSDEAFESLVETGYFAVGNTKIDELLGEQASGLWTVEVHKLTFDLAAMRAALPVSTTFRAGAPGDAVTIAACLDRTHGRSELAPLFSEQWVRSRFTRSPSDYTWTDLSIVDDAVVGTWDPGLELTIERDGAVEVRRQSFALDWGTNGSTDDLLQALRASIENLIASGSTHLSLFASPALSTYATLAGLAAEIDRYRFFCPRVPEPADASERGVFVDPLWF